MLLIEALKSKNKDVFYVAPTYQQAKDILWGLLKELGHEVIAAAHENTSILTLVNGRKIFLKGADRPDTLRGVGLAFVVIDEVIKSEGTKTISEMLVGFDDYYNKEVFNR